MKRILIAIVLVLLATNSFAQSTPQGPKQNISIDSAVVYRLYPTENIYTFIKLNTRNGQMWQVQWSTDDNTFQVPLSLTSLVSSQEEKSGRFFLYPTTNNYNFILLDQSDGRVWQVQWSSEAKERLVIPIY